MAGALLGILLSWLFHYRRRSWELPAGLNQVQVAVLNFLAPAHVDRVGYMAEMAGGSRNALNSWSVFMMLGTVLGGALSGWLNGRMKLEIRKGPHISNRHPSVAGFYRRAHHGSMAPAWPGAALPDRP